MSPSTNAKGFHFPVLETGCTGCSACHMVCPDYVFDVFKFDLPVQSGTESS